MGVAVFADKFALNFRTKWYIRVPVRFFALLTVPETTAIEPDQNTTNTACSLVSPFTMPKPKEPSFLFRPSYVSATKRNQRKENKTKHKNDILYFVLAVVFLRLQKRNETKRNENPRVALSTALTSVFLGLEKRNENKKKTFFYRAHHSKHRAANAR